MNAQYKRVSRRRPCLICGKPDWCSYTPDAAVSFCARVTANADRVSRTGWGVFYHEKSLFAQSKLPCPAKPPPLKKTELAPIEVRDFVYRKLIALSPATVFPEIIAGPKGLQSRKILDFENFGSLPAAQSERRELARYIRQSVNREFPDHVRKFKTGLAGVPGFWIDEYGQAQLWMETEYHYPLMLIPYRNPSGMIQACQIRFMAQSGGNNPRYVWLSTPKKTNSASCGGPLHFVRPFPQPDLLRQPVLVTEGALKAETVQVFYPRFNIVAAGGISSSHSELVEAARFCPLLIGFDNDFIGNRQVLRQFIRFLRARLSDAGKYRYDPDLKILTWSSKFKGIDDALVHNQSINQISLPQWLTLFEDSLKAEICEQLCYSSS